MTGPGVPIGRPRGQDGFVLSAGLVAVMVTAGAMLVALLTLTLSTQTAAQRAEQTAQRWQAADAAMDSAIAQIRMDPRARIGAAAGDGDCVQGVGGAGGGGVLEYDDGLGTTVSVAARCAGRPPGSPARDPVEPPSPEPIVPPIDLALGKPATGTLPTWSAWSNAAQVTDGDTNGRYPRIYHSGNWWGIPDQPYVEVDLGAPVPIDQVVLWNRTDCCGSRNASQMLLISEEPMPADYDGAKAVAAHVSATGTYGTSKTIDMTTVGRYVRVQLTTRNYLQVAEIQVFQTMTRPSGAAELENMAAGRAATGSPAQNPKSTPDRVTDGEVSGPPGLVNFVSRRTAQPYVEVDLGEQVDLSQVVVWNSVTKPSPNASARVLVSAEPMPSDLAGAEVVARFAASTGAFERSHQIPMATTGRYVRVQLDATDSLQVSEIQAYGVADEATTEKSPDRPQRRVQLTATVAGEDGKPVRVGSAEIVVDDAPHPGQSVRVLSWSIGPDRDGA